MKSYDSAFELVIDDPAEVSLMVYKSKLMIYLVDAIRDKQLSVICATHILGACEWEVEDLLAGKISKFSLDWLELAEKRMKDYVKENK